MSLPSISIEELIATIRKTGLPTILVEGENDANIYRWIESQIGTFNGNILPCGGRTVILELYKRKKEFNNSKVIFLADKDMWLFTGTPKEFDEIIWTEGYSIENDLFTGGYSVERLLDDQEKVDLSKIIHSVARWFAFEVEKYKTTEKPLQSYNIGKMLDSEYSLRDKFLEEINFSEANAETFSLIFTDYTLKIRGKTLHSIYVHLLSSPKRKSKFSYENVIELCLKSDNGNFKLNDLVLLIKYRLANWQNIRNVAAGEA
jgi:hypothetical protein